MVYNNVRHECNLYNFFFAPRGNKRMMELGMKITQMYLNPFHRGKGLRKELADQGDVSRDPDCGVG